MTTTYALLDPVTEFLSHDHGLLIGGEEVEAVSGERFDVVNPADGTVLTTVPSAGPADVDAAVSAARDAFPAWRDMPPAQRADLLWRLGTRIRELEDEFAELETLDNGKPIAETHIVDIPLTSDLFRYYAGWVTKIEGQVGTPSFGNFHTYMRSEPVGVVGAIIPWNFPLLMCGYKLGPSLAAGCTVVLKPAEQTPLSALRLAEVVTEVGFPPGVVNVVTGFGESAGAPLAGHTDVDKITFTGEHTTGQKIIEASKSNLKRVSLELGGKSPSLVFDDANMDAALEGTHGAVFFNQGQCCIAGARVFVHENVRDEFAERLAERAGSIRLGSGLDPETTMGPLVSDEQRQRVNGYIESGRSEGARILSGGEPPTGEGLADGYFVSPTVFVDVDPGMKIMREEIFGPVAMVGTFSDEDEAIALANDTRFGLAAGIYTSDVGRAHRVAAQVQAGTVWVNTYGMFDAAIPYGGFKLSGFGKELGREALDLYLQTKTVWVNLDA
jgi:phenylacetaldehyde dehydrogenase